MRIPLLMMFMVLSAAPSWSVAQNTDLLPEGQTLLTLSVTEREMVEQDQLVAVLRMEDQDSDPASLQSRINRNVEAALEMASDVDEVEVSTGRYTVYQYNQSRGNRADMRWRGSQTVRLQSRSSDELLELSGQMQSEGFVMQQLSYQLSAERAEEVRDEMLDRAIVRAREKATRAGEALERGEVEIAELTVEDESGGFRPVMMRAAAQDSAEMSSPVAEAGESEVTLTVRVRAVAQ